MRNGKMKRFIRIFFSFATLSLTMVLVVGIRSQALGEQEPFTNSIGMKFVSIPAGSFLMGSNNGHSDERPVHKVTLTRSFFMQTAEVTQGQWKRVMGNNPSNFKSGKMVFTRSPAPQKVVCDDDCPVERVSWNDAQQFIRKLNQMEGTNKYRLPTEAEWEYACRAGTTTSYSWGEQNPVIEFEPSNGARFDAYALLIGPYSVGAYAPNPWGLYDMHGNVWEWCQDWYGEYPGKDVTDPSGPSSGERRVLRGGSWRSDAGFMRSANRVRLNPDGGGVNCGFRIAKDF